LAKVGSVTFLTKRGHAWPEDSGRRGGNFSFPAIRDRSEGDRRDSEQPETEKKFKKERTRTARNLGEDL